MSEARQHSVDIPLSKTLVALKRVRSLRDPATNSMSKFAVHVDSMNWEMTSCNGTFLELTNTGEPSIVPSLNCALEGGREDHGSNSEPDHSSRTANPKVTYSRKSCVVKVRGSKPRRTKLLHESLWEGARKSVDSNWVPHSRNLLEEEVDSYSEPNFESAGRTNAAVVKKRSGCSRFRRSSMPLEDAAMSRVGSPCMSVNQVRTNCLSRSNLGLATEEVDVVDSSHSGCGLSQCWSRTPKYRDSNLPSDADDQQHPLLSAEGREVANVEASPHTETPRSLSQKFRPRSFNELVGLNVVAQSLLNAIAKGKIAPIYLFHGPRGTGKTSTARIFAAALNCLSLEEHRPCGFCRECVFLFTGRSRDVKELGAAKTNQKDRVKALLRSASLVPFSSRFKVFIIDDCESLLWETWAAILDSLEGLSRHAVFVLVTSDLDKLPRNAVSRCQRYHFPKIKDADIVIRLQKICVEEGLDFDGDALDFIAAKSNGSLRDAETMLDQLGLLGKKITLPLVYEMVGVVSDDELLDLLDLALSSDTANTVRRARELMGSRVDPMQLVSQLANLIMDILAGRSQSSEVCRNIIGRHDLAEVDTQKLRHALMILSETEKQLRTSKNQATWLTVALLQFNNGEASCLRASNCNDDGLSGTTLSRESLRNYICYVCNRNKSNCSGRYCDRTKLEAIWRRTIEKCQSSSLKSFLQKEGYLSSIYMTDGMAIAEVEFCHPDHLSRAEKSWKIIASSLHHILACDMEIRLNLVLSYTRKSLKVKKPSFSLLSCSGRNQEVSDSTLTDDNENELSARRNRLIEAYTCHHRQQSSPFSRQSDSISACNTGCLHCDEAKITTRIEGDARSTATAIARRSVQDDLPNRCKLESDSSKLGEEDQYIKIQEPEVKSSCFAKTLKLQRKFLPSDVAHAICFRTPPSNVELSIPKSASFDTYVCANDPYIFCSRSNAEVPYSSGDDNGPNNDSRFTSRLLCWRAPKYSTKKVL